MALYDAFYDLLVAASTPQVSKLYVLVLPKDQIDEVDLAFAPDGGDEPKRVYGADRLEYRRSQVRLTGRAKAGTGLDLLDKMAAISDVLDNTPLGTYGGGVSGRATEEEEIREIQVTGPVNFDGQDELGRVVCSIGVDVEHKPGDATTLPDYDLLWPGVAVGLNWPGIT